MVYQQGTGERGLAIDLLRDWRIDRFYADRIQLLTQEEDSVTAGQNRESNSGSLLSSE